MATYTKIQFKKRIEELKEKLSSLRIEFEDLQSDLESESSDIEPNPDNCSDREYMDDDDYDDFDN